jgi:hypothetical protein
MAAFKITRGTYLDKDSLMVTYTTNKAGVPAKLQTQILGRFDLNLFIDTYLE